jgi:transposase
MSPFRYIAPLTDDQCNNLKTVKNEAQNERVRKRAHAILLSEQHRNIDDIADICFVNRDTVGRWLDRWEQDGVFGLWDNKRPGRRPILNDEEQELVKKLLDETPNDPKSVLQSLFDKTGKLISRKTLNRLAKKYRLKWKRIKKSLKSKRDNDEFEKAKADITAFEAQAQAGECDVYYFDGSGFDLTPSVSYAWQPTGTDNTITVPSARSSRLNVLGFLNSSNNDLMPYIFEDSVSSAVICACFDNFLNNQIKSSVEENNKENNKENNIENKNLTKPIIVVIDNASIHTSAEFTDHIEKWQSKGLFPYFLPSYSPELNKIEILWRKIKYEWLPLSAYDSLQKLNESVENILIQYGNRYVINFV